LFHATSVILATLTLKIRVVWGVKPCRCVNRPWRWMHYDYV